MGRNNQSIRIVGFMDFGEDVDNGGVRIRDMEGDVLGEKIMERTSI